jgi:Skp family chaperone for outer membrane proteins
VYREVVKTVEDVAHRDGYDLVFYRGQFEPVSLEPDVIREQIRSIQLLYNNPATDITQVVLDKLNADYRALPRQQMLMQSP